jgi:hypothetical protein
VPRYLRLSLARGERVDFDATCADGCLSSNLSGS